MPLQAVLEGEAVRPRRRHRLPPVGAEAHPVVGMQGEVGPAEPQQRLRRVAGVGRPLRREVVARPLRVRCPDQLRQAGDQRPLRRLAHAQRRLGLAPLADVGVRAEPADDPALRVAHRLGARQEPAVGAVAPPDAELALERRLPRHRVEEGRARALRVLRVVPGPAGARLGDLRGVGAGVVIPAGVEPQGVAVRVGDPGHLRDQRGEAVDLADGALAGDLRPSQPGERARQLHELGPVGIGAHGVRDAGGLQVAADADQPGVRPARAQAHAFGVR